MPKQMSLLLQLLTSALALDDTDQAVTLQQIQHTVSSAKHHKVTILRYSLLMGKSSAKLMAI